MRKESTDAARAFLARKVRKLARTESTGDSLRLHGHIIAWWYDEREDPSIYISLRGYATRTTFDRLNTLLRLLDVRIGGFSTRKHITYFGRSQIDPYGKIRIPVTLDPVRSVFPTADEILLAHHMTTPPQQNLVRQDLTETLPG